MSCKGGYLSDSVQHLGTQVLKLSDRVWQFWNWNICKNILHTSWISLSPDWLCGPPSLLSNRHWKLAPWGAEWWRHVTDDSLPSSAKVKNAWNYTYLPSIRLHGVFYGMVLS